ncbi:Two-component hybrid sensor and regulator [Candidatus Burkholderia verschuerenii]|uniref:Two-component hybrid sensor and regulator n=1 Tax=Candidatus Burkholderia verschuerenii TaxID=242163 RepID=A0A0L0ME50_9BURK|nr:response regulator [Candidatus Burkholderia verschuerenii]KND60254.1 Two-component hybrid sensor and regulator [Candidatus Burkholderia verschuerenii]
MESGIGVDLLFTDIVMPGRMRSVDMAAKARALIPQLAVLYTSGYVQDASLDAGADLLLKPYSRETLSRKVRDVLDRRARPALDARATTPAIVRPIERSGPAYCIVLFDRDVAARKETAELLETLGHAIVVADSRESARAALSCETSALTIADDPCNAAAIAFAEEASAAWPRLGIVFVFDGVPTEPPLGVHLVTPFSSTQADRAIRRARTRARFL